VEFLALDGFVLKVLVGLLAKLGVDEFKKRGWMPQSYYVRTALLALKRDDLDQAVQNYNLSVEKRKPGERAKVAHEIIACAIDIRIGKTKDKLAEIQRDLYPSRFSAEYWRRLFRRDRRELIRRLRIEEQGCREALEVLGRLKSQLKNASDVNRP
jgi:hypothetical protein